MSGLNIFFKIKFIIYINHSWLITGLVTRVTRRVPLVEEELPIRLLVFSVVRVTRYVVFNGFIVVFYRLVLFLFAIVLAVLWFTDSDYLFGIFKLFLIGMHLKTVKINITCV
jgi:hypothetical protein